ncbi:MAG: DNA polymerase III subunit chi [Brachymonas sp.]|nr:DNA polymerase III subunit chi [Brachymonas sp.]
MTRIDFHFHVPDKLPYVCRLIRKAVSKSPSLVVTGPQEQLARLDELLWQLGSTDFVGHAWYAPDADGSSVGHEQACARVWLTLSPDHSPRHDLLLNLSDAVATGFEQYERLIEVVSMDEQDRQHARQRWRHYSARGYAIVQHAIGGGASQ